MSHYYKKIMIIDDDSVDRFILRKSLQKAKLALKIIESANGVDALEKLAGNTLSMKEDIPELIFLDVNMPVLNGFEFLDALKQLSREFNNRCRIVVISAHKSESEKKKALSYTNVIGYFEKPLEEEALLELKGQLRFTQAS
jgi:CheY-like chemotaxis protein